MDDRETIYAILDADQGVCPEGHDCHLVWLAGTAIRACDRPGPKATHRPFYHGWPLIADTATPEQIAAVRKVDPDLAYWAEQSIAEAPSVD